MEDKTFVVSHPKARAPITIIGRNLKDALEKEGLNPNVWHPIKKPDTAPEV